MGTEHLLLGLLGDEEGHTARTLLDFDITLDEARVQVERVFGRGRGAAAAELPFSARAKRALEHALRESLAAEDDIITPRHLLLGLAADPSSGAARVLADFDVDKHSLRLAMERSRGPDETGIVGDFILPRFPADGSDQILVEIPPHVDAPSSTIPLWSRSSSRRPPSRSACLPAS